MKNTLLTFLIAALCGTLNAQDLPQLSPGATIMQRVGLTDFTVKYSRPSARGRQVFGELVPYGQLWRTGANQNTTIEFNTKVTFMDQEVEPGVYSLFAIPQQGDWMIMLNRNTDYWGTANYNEGADVLAVDIIEQPTEGFIETFTIAFEELSAEEAQLTLSWANSKVSIPVKVETQEQALKNIEQALSDGASEDDLWRVYRNAAGYYHNNKLDAKKARNYIEESIKRNNESWYSHWLHAQILAEQKEYKKAVKSAEMAVKVGESESAEDGQEFAYANMIGTSIKNWKSMK